MLLLSDKCNQLLDSDIAASSSQYELLDSEIAVRISIPVLSGCIQWLTHEVI